MNSNAVCVACAPIMRTLQLSKALSTDLIDFFQKLSVLSIASKQVTRKTTQHVAPHSGSPRWSVRYLPVDCARICHGQKQVIHMPTRMSIHISMIIPIHMSLHNSVQMCIHAHAHIYIHIHIHVSVCISVHVPIHMPTRMSVGTFSEHRQRTKA